MMHTTLQVRIPKAVVEKIDRLREKLSWHPSRSQTVRWMIEDNMKLLERAAEDADNQVK